MCLASDGFGVSERTLVCACGWRHGQPIGQALLIVAVNLDRSPEAMRSFYAIIELVTPGCCQHKARANDFVDWLVSGVVCTEAQVNRMRHRTAELGWSRV